MFIPNLSAWLRSYLLCIVSNLLLIAHPLHAEVVQLVAPIPAEVSSNHFSVTVNGTRSPVIHASAGYYVLNFDAIGTTTLAVTASDPHYWDAGVEIQPMRLGIRPKR